MTEYSHAYPVNTPEPGATLDEVAGRGWRRPGRGP